MKIIDNLLASTNYDFPVKDIRTGPFQTAVVTRRGGLASTPHIPGPHHKLSPVPEAGSLIEKDAKTLAALVKSASEMEAAIGMATINSLLEVNEKHCREINAADILMQKGEGKKVAIIGHFPFVPKLKQAVGELWVIEKNPHEGDRPEGDAKELLPQADVVGITGTAFINGTIDQLLLWCNPKAYVVILGGTAPLSPLLFDYGINAVAGTLVVDTETVLRGVSQGATFRQLKGIKLLTMTERYD